VADALQRAPGDGARPGEDGVTTRLRVLALVLLVVALTAACGRPPLRVASSGDYPPFSLRAADGTWSGFDVDVARAYAKDAGLSLQLVPFRWPDLATTVAGGEVDVAMSGVTVRPERLLAGVLTGPVAYAQAVLIAPANVATPRRVAWNRGGHLERVARARVRDAELVTVDDNRTLLAELTAGRVDGIVTDTIEARSLLDDPGYRTVAVLSDDRKAYWIAPASARMSQGLDDWLVRRELDGTLPAMRAQWLGPSSNPALPPQVDRIIDLIARRLMLMPMVAAAKRPANLPIEDAKRERDVEAAAAAAAGRAGLDVDTYVAFVRAEVAAAKEVQRATPPDVQPTATLLQLRDAITAIDAAMPWALHRAGVIGTPPARLREALSRDARLPGVDDALIKALTTALLAVR
jgi:cyclohexadienyl dehydratase